MITCKAAPRGSNGIVSRRKKKIKSATDKFKGKKVLCRVKEPADMWGQARTYIIYRDGTWRIDPEEDLMEWDIGYSEKAGPIFLYRDLNGGDDVWTTDFSGDMDIEVLLGKTIAKALGDMAVEDMLKGKFDDKTTENPETKAL